MTTENVRGLTVTLELSPIKPVDDADTVADPVANPDVASNVPLNCPCVIVIDGGTVTTPLFDDKLTSCPPTGAGSSIVTVIVNVSLVTIPVTAGVKAIIVGGIDVAVIVVVSGKEFARVSLTIRRTT